jgi:hypothetical protein
LIIGVSVEKSGLTKNWGAHAFIMYINDPYKTQLNWRQDIMLDAAGHYRIEDRANSNIVRPVNFNTITIDAYRRYFYGKPEILYTYSFDLNKTVGIVIKNKI